MCQLQDSFGLQKQLSCRSVPHTVCCEKKQALPDLSKQALAARQQPGPQRCLARPTWTWDYRNHLLLSIYCPLLDSWRHWLHAMGSASRRLADCTGRLELPGYVAHTRILSDAHCLLPTQGPLVGVGQCLHVHFLGSRSREQILSGGESLLIQVFPSESYGHYYAQVNRDIIEIPFTS